jgi:TonB family protein
LPNQANSVRDLSLFERRVPSLVPHVDLKKDQPHISEMKIDASKAEHFLKSSAPSRTRELVFQCIIVSLCIHVVVLFVTQMLTEDNRIALPEPEYMPIEAELLMEEEILPTPDNEPAMGGPLRNVLANQQSERSSEVRDYRGMTAEQMRQAGAEDAHRAAQEEAKRLADAHSPADLPTKRSNPTQPGGQKSEHEWWNDPNKKSYNGAVTASYSMTGRDALYDPKPSYRCKTSGTVVVKLSIDALGAVKDAQINAGASSTNECLLQESLAYARQWKFSYKEGRSKQEGTISFNFSAQ